MSKRKCYDVSFKLKAVECAERKSKEPAAREYGVDAKRIAYTRSVLRIREKNNNNNKRREAYSSCTLLRIYTVRV